MSANHCDGIYDSIRNGCFDCMKVFYNDKFLDKYSLTNLAVEHGQLHIVMYFRQRGLPFSISTLALAAEFGHLNVVKYLLFSICRPSHDFDYRGAAINEQLHIINYLTAQGVTPNVNAYYGAIEGDHLYIVKYLRQKNFPWDCSVTNRAIKCGNLSILKYLHKHGCKIGLSAINTAAKYKHLNCLEYLHKCGYPCDFLARYYAEINNDVKTLQYLHDNNYPYFEYCGTYAASNGCIDALKFLHERGYKLGYGVCDRASDNYKHETAVYLCSIGYLPKYSTWRIANYAAEKGDIDTLRILLKNDASCVDLGIIAYKAVANGHVNVLMYLRSVGIYLPKDLDYHAFNNIDILKYLNSVGHKFGEYTFRRAVEFGKIDIIDYLLSINCPYDIGIWWYTSKIETLVHMYNRKMTPCSDILLPKIIQHINDLAFKEAKIVRRGFIPSDVWNIIGRMM